MSLWYWMNFGQPERTDNGDGTFTYTWEADALPTERDALSLLEALERPVEPSLPYEIREDPLMPNGAIMAAQMVVAERGGKTYETLPPSAVMARERLRGIR